jgi:hypothetical protein
MVTIIKSLHTVKLYEQLDNYDWIIDLKYVELHFLGDNTWM